LQFRELQPQCFELGLSLFDAESGVIDASAELLQSSGEFIAAACECAGAAFAVLEFSQVIGHRGFGFAAFSDLLMDATASFDEAVIGRVDMQAECSEEVFALGDFVFEAVQFVFESAQFAFAGQECGFISHGTGEECAIGFDEFTLQRNEAAAATDSGMPANCIAECFDDPGISEQSGGEIG
jgi:hypothetical protein